MLSKADTVGLCDSPAVSAVEEIEDADEAQPFRTRSRDLHEEDGEDLKAAIEDFALAHHLAADRVSVLLKAAQYLQRSRHTTELPIADERVSILDLTANESQSLESESTHKWRQRKTLYFTIFICSLGAIEQGWAQTGLNGANLSMPAALGIADETSWDAFILGLINASQYLAQGLVGAWISNPLNTRLGRKGAIAVGATLCLLGNLGSGLSSVWHVLVLCRIILGAGLGITASTAAVFAAESAPAYVRGGLSVCWQMFTAFGIFLGFAANVTLYHVDAKLVWRLQLAVPLAPTIPLLLLIAACPESPSWLVKRARGDRAFDSLARLRNTELQAAMDLLSLTSFTTTSKSSSRELTKKKNDFSFLANYCSLFTTPRARHALLASYTVMLTQQLCGINIIAFFSSTIFSSSGFSEIASLWASVVFGAVNFLGAFPAIWTMDTFGRRRLLLWTLPAMALTMGLTALSFGLPRGTAQFSLLAGLIYLFCALYSPGVGPVPMAYSAEVFPLRVREVGMSFAVSTASLWATVLSLTFPALLRTLGAQATFGLYAALNMLAWTLCWTFVRETKGLKLEEMDQVFDASPLAFVRARLSEVPGVTGWWERRRRKGWTEVRQVDDG